MTVVALYARVSTKGQDTDNQMIRLEELAKSRGYVVFKSYMDVASGKDANRPELDKMMADARQHKFDRILVTKIDRLARSTINLLNLLTELTDKHVDVEFLDQPIDTSTSSGKLTLTILGAIAEFERELIHDRTMDGLARAESQGRHGGRPKRVLSDYQIEKARALVAENPRITASALAAQFDGIDRKTLIKLLREQGIEI